MLNVSDILLVKTKVVMKMVAVVVSCQISSSIPSLYVYVPAPVTGT